MNCGTVLLDKNFQFPDGKTSPKLLIVLCECGTNHLALITTSKAHSKNNNPGCQGADMQPNYFLPKGSCWFDDDTWVQVDEVIELDATVQGYKKQDGSSIEHRDALPLSLMRSILDCALQSDYVDEFYREFLQKTREKI